MSYTLPPTPPVPRTKEQQLNAYSNASFWNDWYNKLREIVNSIDKLIAAGTAGFVTSASANTPGGYPILDSNIRVNTGIDSIEYIISDDTTKGLVLKSPNGTYFKANMSDLGVLTWTNLGTTKP